VVLTSCLSVCLSISDGSPCVGGGQEQKGVGLERHHPRNTLHGPPRSLAPILGRPEDEHRRSLEERTSSLVFSLRESSYMRSLLLTTPLFRL
jgi:hypothetical protein